MEVLLPPLYGALLLTIYACVRNWLGLTDAIGLFWSLLLWAYTFAGILSVVYAVLMEVLIGWGLSRLWLFASSSFLGAFFGSLMVFVIGFKSGLVMTGTGLIVGMLVYLSIKSLLPDEEIKVDESSTLQG